MTTQRQLLASINSCPYVQLPWPRAKFNDVIVSSQYPSPNFFLATWCKQARAWSIRGKIQGGAHDDRDSRTTPQSGRINICAALSAAAWLTTCGTEATLATLEPLQWKEHLTFPFVWELLDCTQRENQFHSFSSLLISDNKSVCPSHSNLSAFSSLSAGLPAQQNQAKTGHNLYRLKPENPTIHHPFCSYKQLCFTVCSIRSHLKARSSKYLLFEQTLTKHGLVGNGAID